MTRQEITEALELCSKLEMNTAGIEQQLDCFNKRHQLACDSPTHKFEKEHCESKSCLSLCRASEKLHSELTCALFKSVDAAMQCRAIIELIEDPVQRSIMRLHYVDGYDWQRVSEMVHYSLSSCMKYRKNALDQLCKTLADRLPPKRNGYDDFQQP